MYKVRTTSIFARTSIVTNTRPSATHFSTMPSLLRQFTPRALRPSFHHTLHQPTRSFTAASRLRLKEDKERTPEEADALKEQQRQKAEKGKGEWHEGLASQSESHVAADQQEVGDHGEHMSELQRETAGRSQREHEEGKGR